MDKEKSINIQFAEVDNDSINCQIEASAPFSGDELILGMDTLITMYSQAVNVHPILIVQQLQNYVVNKEFNPQLYQNGTVEDETLEDTIEDNKEDKSHLN